MAILEYYAFDAEQTDKTTALKNFRALGDSALRRLIFLSVGIDPENPLRSAWQCFHERLQLNSQTPFGFFSIFSEMADLSLKMINSGFDFGPAAIPDISVGTFWGKHWVSQTSMLNMATELDILICIQIGSRSTKRALLKPGYIQMMLWVSLDVGCNSLTCQQNSLHIFKIKLETGLSLKSIQLVYLAN
ncbi:hypothetical protein [Yersinia rohdei]|uniref:hypothetical protein n=1 Tax=Yersinia rohdei TaxID=29485 RepID=UPI001E525E2E|nr:hypothetical protein [Yersinia rohdei]